MSESVPNYSLNYLASSNERLTQRSSRGRPHRGLPRLSLAFGVFHVAMQHAWAEVIWSPEVAAVAAAILTRSVLICLFMAMALIFCGRRLGRRFPLGVILIGAALILCFVARPIEVPVAQTIYCLATGAGSVGFWRLPQAGFWSMHTDWIAPALGIVLGLSIAACYLKMKAEPGAPPNGGPAAPDANSRLTEGPPSVS